MRGGSTARRLYVNLKWFHYYSNSILAGKGFCCAVLDHLHCASVQWWYGRAGQATYDCNIKWLSPDQLQSSPLHHINSVFVACSTVLPYLLCLFPCPSFSFFSPIHLSSLPSTFSCYLFPSTEATVVINCTKEDYDRVPHDHIFGEWSKSLGLELTVGDIVTDVKLVCSSQTLHTTLICAWENVAPNKWLLYRKTTVQTLGNLLMTSRYCAAHRICHSAMANSPWIWMTVPSIHLPHIFLCVMQ